MIKFFQSVVSLLENAFDGYNLGLAGQSNQRANTLGDPPSTQYRSLIPKCFEYVIGSDSFRNTHYDSTGSIDGLLFGSELVFGTNADAAGKETQVGKRAVGSTSIAHEWKWDTGNLAQDFYTIWQALKDRAIERGLKTKNIIDWNQGEANSRTDNGKALTTSQYKVLAYQLFYEIHTINPIDVLVIWKLHDGLPAQYDNLAAIQQAQEEIIAEIKGDLVTDYSSETPELQNKISVIQTIPKAILADSNNYQLGSDSLHYSGAAAEAKFNFMYESVKI